MNRWNESKPEREWEPCEIAVIIGTLVVVLIGIAVGVAIATA